jgi:hypothetical protein
MVPSNSAPLQNRGYHFIFVIGFYLVLFSMSIVLNSISIVGLRPISKSFSSHYASCLRIRSFTVNSRPSFKSTTTNVGAEEYLFVPQSFPFPSQIKALLLKRPHLKIIQLSDEQAALHKITLQSNKLQWNLYRNQLQLDSAELETLYLGKQQMSDEETSEIWKTTLDQRAQFLQLPLSSYLDGIGPWQEELNVAMTIVTRTSFISRSLQYYYRLAKTKDPRIVYPMSLGETFPLQNTTSSSLDKLDASPVTIVDFAVQAIILHTLHLYFPNDLFIAEETSQYLHDKPEIVAQILEIIVAARSCADRALDAAVFKNAYESRRVIKTLSPAC